MIIVLNKATTSRKFKKLVLLLLLVGITSIIYFNFKSDFVVLYNSGFGDQGTNVSQFVGFDDCVKDGRRLGNQIFALAALIYVAQLTGRKPVLHNSSSHLLLEDVFQLNLEHFDDDICPCYKLSEERPLSYDAGAEDRVLKSRLLSKQSILVSGFRQSWKYTRAIERRLRRHLVFQDDIVNPVEDFLENCVPAGWMRAGFVRVGIHVRRGDIVSPSVAKYGYTVPSETYFRKAMEYFIEKYGRVQFIVASDDFNWTSEHIVVDRHSTGTINITYSFNHTAGQDMALLSMCDHVIMSTGTFGWWAAWLAKGTTIYYSEWPRKGSDLEQQFKREDFFPPQWIPMSD